MKKTLACIFPLDLFVALALVVARQVLAQEGVYLVDMQRVINESIVGQAARRNLEGDAKKRSAALEGDQREVAKLQDEIRKQEALLSPAALQDKREILEAKGRDLSRRMQDSQEELKRAADGEMLSIVKDIRGVIAELGASGRYGFIMEKDPRLVVYADEKLDLTALVVERLNKKKVNL